MKDESVTIESLNKTVEKIVELINGLRKDNSCGLSGVRMSTDRMEKHIVTALGSITKKVEGLEEYLAEVILTNRGVEDAILNVLLAIRQNEYLQAWYPPQKGYPEMKVVGTHPMNVKEKVAE